MIVFTLTAAALAQDAGGVESVVWARPFVLAQAEQYTMQAERPMFTEGLLIELRADPALLVPRQVGVPVLYVGDVPAQPFNWDSTGGCVVAFVPGKVDLATTEVYFGSTELPERVTAQKGAQERAAARTAGVRVFPVAEVTAALTAGGAKLEVADLRGVHALAMERVAACTSTPQDLQRAGIPNR